MAQAVACLHLLLPTWPTAPPEIEAAHAAKGYIKNAISEAGRLQVGQGHGPVYHFL